jgi:hypothetical protein
MRTVILALLLIASPALSEDLWIMRGAVGECPAVTWWRADAILQNRTSLPQTVRAVHVSGGPTPEELPDLTIAPGATVTLDRTEAIAWKPASRAAIWVVQIDVPDGVLVENVLRIGDPVCSLPPAPDTSASRGVQLLPVRHALVDANAEQVFLETDLGLLPYRVNVATFNAGEETAVVTAVVRSACDDSVLATQVVSIEPDSFMQISLNPGAPNESCDTPIGVTPWSAYTVVTVTQPSVVWISTLGEEKPRSTISIQ